MKNIYKTPNGLKLLTEWDSEKWNTYTTRADLFRLAYDLKNNRAKITRDHITKNGGRALIVEA